MMPRLIITRLLENSWIRMTVVKPPNACPNSFCTRAMPPNTREASSMSAPRMVTS